MTNKFFAKPILENRFWILESDGEKVGTICRQEDRRYMFSCSDGTRIFDTQQQLQKKKKKMKIIQFMIIRQSLNLIIWCLM